MFYRVKSCKKELSNLNEEKKELKDRINLLESVRAESLEKERLHHDDKERLRDELFMVLDNL